jgi:PAS domain S-box-containing protein
MGRTNRNERREQSMTTDDIDEAKRLAAECARLRRCVELLEAERDAHPARQSEPLAAAQRLSGYVIESAHEGIIVYGPDLRYRVWNPCMERMSGKKAVEVVGKHPFDVFPFLKDVGVAARLERALAGEVPDPVEFAFEVAGRTGWVVDTSAPLRDETGRVVGVIATVQDITERKRAQETMVRRQREIEALFSAARDVLGSDDFTSTARKLFDTARALTGAEAGYVAILNKDGTNNDVLFLEAGGRSCTVDPALPMPVRGLRERAYHTGRAVVDNDFHNGEWASLMPAGHLALRNVAFAPLNIAGKVVGVLGLANKPGDFDAEDLRIAEVIGDLAAIALSNHRNVDLLRSSEERFRTLFENGPDPIFMQQDGRFVYVNRALVGLYGAQTADDLLGTETLARVAPEYHGIIGDRIRDQLETGQAVPQLEMAHIRLDGTRVPVESTAVAVPFRGGTGHLVFLRDISDRLDRRRSLENSEKKFRNLFDNASIGMFRTRLDGSEMLDINDACSKILQSTRADTVGRPSVVHWPDPQERAEVMRRLATELRITDFECEQR